TLFDNHPVQQYSGFNPIDFRFDDYVEGAKRFDNLANLIRSSTPTDPFANYQKPCESTSTSRSRTNSAKDQKHGP
nr:Chain E, RNP (RRM RNA binding domain) containing [Caenorhabditis elegans]5JNB_F Chain F, RNP (RRM RNA binding domain) containing [Caenorhabditis elegans]5JNB_G Chain G, RNP (RRM RNA binding domain) containing [Caenorhabditis elegans]5JNB_H Chain H, RNP (RRM RNA binding domain) containing [Caenorhabditis elegans]